MVLIIRRKADKNMNNEQITNNFNIILTLEWLGICIEETKEEVGDFGITGKTVYYYSVPESSTIEVDDENLNNAIKTSDGLKLLAKGTLIDIAVNACKEEYPDDEEFIEDLKNNASNYFKFRARVRTGEVWTKEMGDNRVKELCEDITKASQYTEV